MKKQNWMELSSIQLGGALCLPVILIGHKIVEHASLFAAIVSIIIGNALLFGGAYLSSRMSHESGKTTPENAETYFGSIGKRFFALIIVGSLACWFTAITAGRMIGYW